jgi:hypothetical protein
LPLISPTSGNFGFLALGTIKIFVSTPPDKKMDPSKLF